MEDACGRRGRETHFGSGRGARLFNWALARNGIYFLDHRDNGAVLEFFDFATGKTTTVLTSNRPQSVGLAVTADGRSILYVESELEESSIMLVKNFR